MVTINPTEAMNDSRRRLPTKCSSLAITGRRLPLVASVALLVLLPTLIVADHLYTNSDKGIEVLTSNSFKSKTRDGFWLVQFYAPWCGHCKAFTEDFKKIASALDGVGIGVGAVNGDEEGELASSNSVKGFPTIKLFYEGRLHADYNGQRTAGAVVDWVLSQFKDKVKGKLSGGGGGGRSGGGGDSGSGKDGVVHLTDDTFKSLVQNGAEDTLWLVEFYAPWCGHCKALEPTYKSLAKRVARELPEGVKVASLDATVYKEAAGSQGIQGFPTIKLFFGGKMIEDYQGGRDESSLFTFLESKHESLLSVPPPPLAQLTSDAQFKESCEKGICVLSFLPHLYDCGASCRKEYTDMLEDLMKGYKKWRFIWTEGFLQQKLEDALGVGGFGYPALVVINGNKMKYSTMRGSYSRKGIGEYLKALSYGSSGGSPSVPLPSFPSIVKVEAWDGKDLPPPEEEPEDKDEL